jgi:hypothetical protein
MFRPAQRHLKLMQMRLCPAHDHLEVVMVWAQGVLARHNASPPDRRLNFRTPEAQDICGLHGIPSA